jgi:hypothetical protein
MKHVSSCLSVLVLSTMLSLSSVHAQTTESVIGNGGTGVSAAVAPVGQSAISVTD